ncbi:LVIVD repeat-containing protein [Chitinophaga skermanii]|uniref:LVIVD repeat-containing protein n=1 Tax=Chitinophaga skermanii TaxID=331697 RepID=A0A327QXI1_9BACT|nr:hypothetical protein [Chitinophaga skermanii]RAJ08434.1 LVIVD repeat-containing protein [Chitinophaga skermanii]
MKQHILALLGFAVILGTACNKSNNDNPTEDPKIIVNTDAAALAKRISLDGAGVLTLESTSSIARKAKGEFAKDGDQASQYLLELVAEVAPPTYNGVQMRATSVDINGNYAYVSYNREGEVYLGGVSVFDISNIQQPKLLSEALFPSTDISAVKYFNGRLYVAGATSVDKDPSFTTPGIVGYVDIANNIPTGNFKFYSVPGQVATGLTILNGKIYAVSGATGGLSVINASTFAAEKYVTSADLRSVVGMTNKVAVLSGTNGVTTFSTVGDIIKNIALPTDVAEAQRNIDAKGDYVIVAAGKNGVQYYNSTSGAKTGQIDIPAVPTGVDPSDVVTNGVSYNNDGLFFSANGAAGVYVAKEGANNSLELLGSLDLTGSSNYVKSAGNYIFVANGRGGLKIIKMTKPTTNLCGNTYPSYTGSAWLNVNSGEKKYYSGAAALQGVNVNDVLYFCGSMTVESQLNINSQGVFDIHGSLAFGKYNAGTTMNVNGTWNVEGSVVIYGDLTLNSGAKINFLGSGASITIYGKVTKNSGVTITGTYTDTFNKLK